MKIRLTLILSLLLVCILSEVSSQDKKGIVISGGGARGAWGAGVAKALSLSKKNNYEVAAGASTGNLMSPMVLLQDFDRLEEAYTSVEESDIFNISPFNKNGDIRYFKVGWRVLTGKKTFGESKPLLQLIRKFISPTDFNELINQNLDFGASVTNLTTGKPEMKEIDKYSHEDMVHWMWASANTPGLMSTLEKDGQLWGDGGFTNTLPIRWVLEKGCTQVDVIIHKSPELVDDDFVQTKGAMQLLFRTIGILVGNVAEFDIEIAELDGIVEKGVQLNFYYMTNEQLEKTKNPLVFDKTVMTDLFEEGYQSVIDGTIITKSYKVNNTGHVVPVISE